MKLQTIIGILCLASTSMILTSCLGDDNSKDYEQWRLENEQFVSKCSESIVDGRHEYQKVSHSWLPQAYVYMKWHNDRALTADALTPQYNSTVGIKYQLELCDGTKVENSFSQKDSLYTSQPLNNITGMQVAMMSMHVGDSVTVVIPWQYAYGSSGNTSVLPYSSLVFHMKLKKISGYQVIP